MSARLSDQEIERRLSGVKSLDELDGFRRGLELQGRCDDHVLGLIAMRRAQLLMERAQ